MPSVLHAGTPVREKERTASHRILLRGAHPFHGDFTHGIVDIMGYCALDVPVVVLHSPTIMCGVGDPKLFTSVDRRKRNGKSAVEDDRMVGLDPFSNLFEVPEKINRCADLSTDRFPLRNGVKPVVATFRDQSGRGAQTNLGSLPGEPLKCIDVRKLWNFVGGPGWRGHRN